MIIVKINLIFENLILEKKIFNFYNIYINLIIDFNY